MTEIGLSLLVLVGLVLVVSLIERRSKAHGSIVPASPTSRTRWLAAILGAGFLVIFFLEISSAQLIHIVFPLLGIGLLLYALGSQKLLSPLRDRREPQGPSHPMPSATTETVGPVTGPIPRSRRLARIVLLLLGLAAFTYGAAWIAANPGSPLLYLYVVIFAALIVLAQARGWLGLWQLFRRISAGEEREIDEGT